MKSITQLIKFLFSGLGKGLAEIRIMAPPVALPYLLALQRFTLIAVGIPIVCVVVGFGFYWISLLGEWRPDMTSWLGYLKPLWRISVLLGGASALGFGTLLAVLAAPIGALISAATVSPQGGTATRVPLEKLPWYHWLSPIGILREFRDIGAGLMQSLRTAIERYISAVRTVLVMAGFGFFFFSALPRPNVTLLLFCIVGVATIWLNRAYRTIWSWLAQAAAIAVMLMWTSLLIFTSLFPKLEPEKLVLGGKSAKEFSNADLTSRWDVWVAWVANHWIGVAIGLAVMTLLTYLLVKLFAKATTSATTGGVHHAATTSHHGGGTSSGWIGTALGIALLLLVVAYIGKVVLGAHEDRSARIDNQIEDRRARQEILRQTVLAAQVPTRTTVVASVPVAPSATPEIWCDLRSPTKYTFQFTTNWSRQIPRPGGMSVRTSPTGLDYEIRENGVRVLEKNSAGMVEFTSGTRFIEVRSTDATRPPIEMTVGVGHQAH